MKEILELSQADIVTALREWCVRVKGRHVDSIDVTPSVTTLGYGVGEYQGAVVNAKIVLGRAVDPQQ